MIEADLRTLLDRIETKLDQIINRHQTQNYYSTSDIAEILKRSEFTVRQWCRLRRVHAEKRLCGRGRSQEWMISHSELQRIQSEGLLPLEH
jgi:hypothetical protein